MKNQNLFSIFSPAEKKCMCMREKESELKKAPENNRPTVTRSGF